MMKEYLIPGEHNNFRPRIFDGISAASLAILVIVLFVTSAAIPAILNNTGLLSAIYPAALVDLTNEARVSSSLSPLTINEDLTLAAQLKASDMASKGYFSHNSPEGTTPWYWIGVSGYKFIYAGENLAVDFSYSKDVNDAWLASTSHRDNILSPNFTEIGIAIAEGEFEGKETTYVVQMFGTPAPVVERPVVNNVEPKVIVKEQVETETEKYIEVQNEEITVEEPVGAVRQAEAPGYDKYVTWYEWVALNPEKTIEYALYTAASLIAILLILMIFINIKIQHPKSLTYGFFILAILLISIYLHRSGIASEFVNKFFY